MRVAVERAGLEQGAGAGGVIGGTQRTREAEAGIRVVGRSAQRFRERSRGLREPAAREEAERRAAAFFGARDTGEILEPAVPLGAHALTFWMTCFWVS